MIISPTEKGNEFFGAMYAEADSADQFTKAVRRQYQLGADWIKIMGTGAVMNPAASRVCRLSMRKNSEQR